jgi:hypothetical protein
LLHSGKPGVHGVMGCGQKDFMLVRRCHQLLSGFLVNVHLLRVSFQSLLSANDKGDNNVKPGAVHRSPDISLRLSEPCKASAKRSSDEGSATSHPLKWSSLPPNDIVKKIWSSLYSGIQYLDKYCNLCNN